MSHQLYSNGGAVSSPRVSVIIPTRNEALNLPLVLEHIPAEYEVVVVDGHSTDGSLDVAKVLRPDAIVLTQTRRGKGNAMACGFAAATGDILVMLDADGSADPREIPRYVRALMWKAPTSRRGPASPRVAAATTSRASAGWATGASTQW